MVGEMADEGVERGSLSELYVAYAPDGIRLAFLLTGDRALAEDLVLVDHRGIPSRVSRSVFIPRETSDRTVPGEHPSTAAV